MQDKRMTLTEAVNRYVVNGCSLTLGSANGREPFGVACEIVRQRKKDLILVTDSQTDAGEMLIAGGCLKKLETAYLWVGVIGMGYNYRRAMEKGIPNYLEVEDYSNLGMSMRFMAGAFGLPFMPTKSMLGTDIAAKNPNIKIIEDPFGTGPIALVPAARPDVAFVHVQRADIYGNAQIWGAFMNDDLIARAAEKVVLTCEKVVPTSELRKIPNMTAINAYSVTAVVELPFGCHPLGVTGCYWVDNPFRQDIMEAAKTREGIVDWINEWIYNVEDHEAYLKKVGYDRLERLQEMELDNNRIPSI